MSELIPREDDAEQLRRAIEDFYLPKNLVQAIYDIGKIPGHSTETNVGIGFIDIADYTYLSKFLSPKENQIVLNGLYTAFQIVLEHHGGYLNKLEGDSMMFHFDGIINAHFRNLPAEEQLGRIARELFYTCVEMQRVCALFNQASTAFVDAAKSASARRDLQAAFDIIHNLRTSSDLADSLHAFFQIRIRIGANIGEVTIGNFGPEGAKQWDVIGMPVIDAKRMEASAPIGGLRISEVFYQTLLKNRVVDDYYQRFRREAQAMGSVYQHIELNELFMFREVVLKQKKQASFRTYSVQVNPGLPESLAAQTQTLLAYGEMGANRILEIMQYYRGNRFVIDLLEALFRRQGIHLRKLDLLNFIQPKAWEDLQQQLHRPYERERHVEDRFSLFDFFQLLDEYQDTVQRPISAAESVAFLNYETTMHTQLTVMREEYERRKYHMVQRSYFFEVVYPCVFLSIKNSIMEYQYRQTNQLELLQAVD
jgi:adenylate cyclase